MLQAISNNRFQNNANVCFPTYVEGVLFSTIVSDEVFYSFVLRFFLRCSFPILLNGKMKIFFVLNHQRIRCFFFLSFRLRFFLSFEYGAKNPLLHNEVVFLQQTHTMKWERTLNGNLWWVKCVMRMVCGLHLDSWDSHSDALHEMYLYVCPEVSQEKVFNSFSLQVEKNERKRKKQLQRTRERYFRMKKTTYFRCLFSLVFIVTPFCCLKTRNHGKPVLSP